MILIPILIENKIGYLDEISIKRPWALAWGIHRNKFFSATTSTQHLLILDNPNAIRIAEKKLYDQYWDLKGNVEVYEQRIKNINFSLLILDKFQRGLVIYRDHVGFLTDDRWERDKKVILKTLGSSRYDILLGKEVAYKIISPAHDIAPIRTKKDVKDVKKVLINKIKELRIDIDKEKGWISDIEYSLSRIDEMRRGIDKVASAFLNRKSEGKKITRLN
jgi:hypothetical protein